MVGSWELSFFYGGSDSGDHFGRFWPLFPHLVPFKLRRTGQQIRLVGILRKSLSLFLEESCF